MYSIFQREKTLNYYIAISVIYIALNITNRDARTIVENNRFVNVVVFHLLSKTNSIFEISDFHRCLRKYEFWAISVTLDQLLDPCISETDLN